MSETAEQARIAKLERALREIIEFRPEPSACDPAVHDDPYIQMARRCKAIAREALSA